MSTTDDSIQDSVVENVWSGEYNAHLKISVPEAGIYGKEK